MDGWTFYAAWGKEKMLNPVIFGRKGSEEVTIEP